MLGNENFNSWLLESANVEKYSGITSEKFAELHESAIREAKQIAQAIFGSDADGQLEKFLDSDTPQQRLAKMLEDGDVVELGGLFWTARAIRDAEQAFNSVG